MSFINNDALAHSAAMSSYNVAVSRRFTAGVTWIIDDSGGFGGSAANRASSAWYRFDVSV